MYKILFSVVYFSTVRAFSAEISDIIYKSLITKLFYLNKGWLRSFLTLNLLVGSILNIYKYEKY